MISDMDIAFVSNVVYPFVMGGAQKRIYEIGTRLAENGHDITVYSRHYWDGPETANYEELTLKAVAPAADLYEEQGRRSISEAIDFAGRLIPPLHQSIDQHDLVVVSVFPYFPVLSTKLCTITTDTPVITTWHEVWRDYWDEYLGYLAPFGKVVERLTARVPQIPVAVSDVTANRLSQIGPARNRITVIPNGIDIERIQSISPSENGFDILYVGRLIEDKHVDLLLRAFDRVAQRNNLTIGVIGEGPRRKALECVANECDASGQITFLGFLEDYDEVLAHMKAAKVFASISTREGFGITYLEAMAAGCEVIGADHPESAASEVIDDAGYLTKPQVETITTTLEKALVGQQPPYDPRNVAEQYDWDSVTEQAEEAYNRAITEPK